MRVNVTAKFRRHYKQHRIPFYLVFDFESFLSPVNDEELGNSRGTHVIQEHHVSGFACYRMTDNAEYQTQPTAYSGPEVMTKFYEHVMSESKVVGQIIASDEQIKNANNTATNRVRPSKVMFQLRTRI